MKFLLSLAVLISLSTNAIYTADADRTADEKIALHQKTSQKFFMHALIMNHIYHPNLPQIVSTLALINLQETFNDNPAIASLIGHQIACNMNSLYQNRVIFRPITPPSPIIHRLFPRTDEPDAAPSFPSPHPLLPATPHLARNQN